MKLLLACILMFSFMSCSNLDVDKVKTQIADSASKGIAKSLECDRQDVIKADLMKLLKVQEMEGEQSAVLQKVCKIAVKQALPLALEQGVPDRWECKLDMANTAIEKLADVACAQL